MDSESNVETIEQVLGKVVEILQKIRGVKNKELSEFGVSSSQLSQIKAGTKSLSVDKLFQLSKGLGVPVSTIMHLVEDQLNNRHSKVILIGRICQKIDEIEREEATYQEELAKLNEK